MNSGEPCSSVKDKIKNVLGLKYHEQLLDFHLPLDGAGNEVCGFVSRQIDSGSQYATSWIKKCLLFCYVNERPIEPFKQLVRVFNEVYKQFNSNCKFFFVLNFKMQEDCVDVNLSPDKRELYLKNEKQILNQLREHLISLHQQQESFPKLLVQKESAASKLAEASSLGWSQRQSSERNSSKKRRPDQQDEE